MFFLTGFPGFLGTRLVDTLAAQHPKAEFALLVQPKFEAKAQRTLATLTLTDRATIFQGDITAPDLGLGAAYDELTGQITKAFHLAAIYDLSIARPLGWRVNVDGTRHVVDFLARCPHLEAFGYVSTAYVSGRRTGTIYEDELVHTEGFKNHYEETKYHAELVVQARRDAIPTVIFRPGIVVGDSQTGATDKFDGPYYILQALRRLPRLTLMTKIGSGQHPVNLVPINFVVAAMAHLIQHPDARGSVFHLTDPNPMTTQAILELFTDLLDMRAAFVPVPPRFARMLLEAGVGPYLGIAPELIDYFDFPARYDSSHAQRLLGDAGIACPPLDAYAHRMVAFLREHGPEVRSTAMY